METGAGDNTRDCLGLKTGPVERTRVCVLIFLRGKDLGVRADVKLISGNTE